MNIVFLEKNADERVMYNKKNTYNCIKEFCF